MMTVTVDFDDGCEMMVFLTASMKNEINNGRVLHFSVQRSDVGDIYETRTGEASESLSGDIA